MTFRDVAKRLAPHVVRKAVQQARGVWADLRLRLLVEVGFLPSHKLRNAIYRRAGMSIGRMSSIHWRAEFYAPERISIASNVIIGYSVFMDGRYTISIGENVNVGSHVSIFTGQHNVDSPDFAEEGAGVRIERYAWVASRAIILPGVTIGEGAVVAAGAVVPRDVAPYTVVAGNPARKVRDRSRHLTYQLRYAKRFV